MRKPPHVTTPDFVPSRDDGQRAVYQAFGAWHVAIMLALLLAAAIVAPSDRTAARAAAGQAQISIRIISGARVQLGRSSDDETALVHQTSVRLDNRPQSAYLVEFR